MRAVIQRVRSGKVTVNGALKGEIGRGLVVLVGVGCGDGPEDVRYLAEKTANLRIFEDDNGKMNLSCLDVGGEVLAVSQFTLYGDCRHGRRPSFSEAAPPDVANVLYGEYVQKLREQGLRVATGEFGAMMLVEIQNDGPVTILLDSKKIF
ncbi:MAG TPA: D-tyrosyl-tRNA(Tyr) deacylase [Firmicutes bacterium]|nr:D-tyrosyl-tRNA(Tyr) deacylase [Bacillota bacterium]